MFETFAEAKASIRDVYSVARIMRSGRRPRPILLDEDQKMCRVTLGASYGDTFLGALALGHVNRSHTRVWNPVEHRGMLRHSRLASATGNRYTHYPCPEERSVPANLLSMKRLTATIKMKGLLN